MHHYAVIEEQTEVQNGALSFFSYCSRASIQSQTVSCFSFYIPTQLFWLLN